MWRPTLNGECLCVSPPDQGDWNGNQRAAPGKAPLPSRGAKTSYREHPYQQYWSGRAALKRVPPTSSCLPWQLALSSPTKVIVRFVFGSFFSTLYTTTLYSTTTTNPLPLPHPPLPNWPPVLPTKVALRWVREEKLASIFLLLVWLFGWFCCILFSDPTLWPFCVVDRTHFKCLGVLISSGVNGSLSNELSKEFILIVF